MQHVKTGSMRGFFDMAARTRSAQAAMMTLPPDGTSDDEPSNEHPKSEQWLYVLSGTGEAMIGKKKESLHRVKLGARSLLVIEKGELHQIGNTGRRPMVTLNLYVPPAYDDEGELKE